MKNGKANKAMERKTEKDGREGIRTEEGKKERKKLKRKGIRKN